MDDNVKKLADMIFGEAANQDTDVMTMVGSTALNRLNAKKAVEFGGNLDEVLKKGYYAVSNMNMPYKQAIMGLIEDPKSKEQYGKALKVAESLITGVVKPFPGHFYFTNNEIIKLKKNKAFNFELVKELGNVGKYRVFSY